jgi:hypothetical protein
VSASLLKISLRIGMARGRRASDRYDMMRDRGWSRRLPAGGDARRGRARCPSPRHALRERGTTCTALARTAEGDQEG